MLPLCDKVMCQNKKKKMDSITKQEGKKAIQTSRKWMVGQLEIAKNRSTNHQEEERQTQYNSTRGPEGKSLT